MADEIRTRSFGELHGLRILELTTAEQFVVGVCRCWDAFLDGGDAVRAWRELAPVFVYMDVPSALCAFDRAFSILRRHRTRILRFYDADSPRLGLDEARVLAGLAYLQRGDARGAHDSLRAALTGYGIHAVLPPLARIAAVLDVRGHRLPPWRDTPWRDTAGARRAECLRAEPLSRRRSPASPDESAAPPGHRVQ